MTVVTEPTEAGKRPDETHPTAMRETQETIATTINVARLAWIVISISFVFFCASITTLTSGIYFFFFHSTRNIETTVEISRGTAGILSVDYAQRILTNTQSIENTQRGSRVSTDAQSEAVITYSIPVDEGMIDLVTVTLMRDSQVTLARASQPRYSWSNGRYILNLNDFSGSLHVYIAEPDRVARPLRLTVDTVASSSVLLEAAGLYRITYRNGRLDVTCAAGQAVLLPPDRVENRLVVPGVEGVWHVAESEDSPPRPPYTVEGPQNLIQNGLFAFQIPDQAQMSPPSQTTNLVCISLLRWGCTESHESVADPRIGHAVAAEWRGRKAVRFFREDTDSNGENGFKQPFGNDNELGLFVADLNSLNLYVTFLINHQSLSECGQLGSECPLMIQLTYFDGNGDERIWYQGFYAQSDPSYEFPPNCVTCPLAFQAHRYVRPDVWHTYESGNLFNAIPADLRPAYLKEIKFYASGHEYDVYVSDLALYADRSPLPEPLQTNTSQAFDAAFTSPTADRFLAENATHSHQ